MKGWRLIALLGLIAWAPALAQDEPPQPAPLPDWHAPLTDPSSSDEVPPSDPAGQDPALAPASSEEPPPPAAPVTTDPQPVTLMAEITDGGKTISDGLVWRIFSTKPDTTGQLQLAGKSDSAVARLQLPPGTYVVHVAYGRAQASDTITVVEGPNTKQLVLEAGGLRLNAAVTGDVPIPINLLHFDVFTAGQSDADRALIVQGLGANDVVTLNAGTYHIVSYFGDVNAVVRADLRVEPGQMTDATIYHRAAQTSFKLVSEAGGEAIADVDWTVRTPDGTTIFTDTGAFPSTVLEEGDYIVLAKRGEKVFNREFQVQPGQPREIEVLTIY